MVIVFPEMLTDAAELCAAVDVYAPGVPRWQYGPASNPTLRPIVDADVNAWSGRIQSAGAAVAEVVVPRVSRAGGPQLRLAGEGPAEGLDNRRETADAEFSGEAPSPPVARSGPLITDEELRMLLGESNEENR